MLERIGAGTNRRPLWKTMPSRMEKSGLPCARASRHSTSSLNACLKRSGRTELSMESVVRVKTDMAGGEDDEESVKSKRN